MTLYDGLMARKDAIEDPLVKTYLDVIFDYNPVCDAFVASETLVEHTYRVVVHAQNIMNVQTIGKYPPSINRDVVLAGALVCSIGKLYARTIGITPTSYSMSIQAFIQAESILGCEIPEEIKDRINECILTPLVAPQSIEARIVHTANMIEEMIK